MTMHPTTHEPRDAGRREHLASAASSAETDARRMLTEARAKAVSAVKEALSALVCDADLALGPVDGSSGSLDELRELRDDFAGLIDDALAGAEVEIDRRADAMQEGR